MKTRFRARTLAAFLVAAWLVPVAAYAKYDVPDLIRAKRAHAASVEKEKSPAGTVICPVTGAKADESVFLTYRGKKIHFCCSNCEKPFAENPDKYLR